MFQKKWCQGLVKNLFDHTTCVSADDPELPLFEEMDDRGIIDLRVFPNGVGCEKFAEYVALYLQDIVNKETDGRVSVSKVQCWEHNDNMAEYHIKK